MISYLVPATQAPGPVYVQFTPQGGILNGLAFQNLINQQVANTRYVNAALHVPNHA